MIQKRERITNPAELRSLLADSICAVMEGRMNISQANAVVGLSSELHKSVRQQWDQEVYLAENLSFDKAQVVRANVLEDKSSCV